MALLGLCYSVSDLCLGVSRKRKRIHMYPYFPPPDRPPTDHRAQRGEEKHCYRKNWGRPRRSVGNFAISAAASGQPVSFAAGVEI